MTVFKICKIVMHTREFEIQSAGSREEATRMLDSDHPQLIFKTKLGSGETLRPLFTMSENIAVSTGVNRS
jgi:hypothetical protein